MYKGTEILTETVTLTAAVETGRCVSVATGAYPTAGARGDGIALCRGDAGDDIAIASLGTAFATAGAQIAVGALLEVGTAGKLITKNTGIGVARARTAAAADGDEFKVFILPN